MPAPRLVLCLVLLFPFAAGAGDAALRDVQSRRHEIRFQLPGDWNRAPLDDEGALLFLSPATESGWQTNVLIEEARDRRLGRTHAQLVDTLVRNLARARQDFVLLEAKPVVHASGLRAAELVYTHTLSGVPVTEKELILRLGGDRLVVVTGSATTPLWTKYQPEIDAVLGSIRPYAAPPASPAR